MENLFRKEVLEHKQHRLEGTVSLVQPPVFKYLTVLILTVVVVSLVFLTLGKYTRKERVTGFIEPSAGLLKLSAGQAGVVSEVLVKEGESVKKGQALLRIASAKHSTQDTELNHELLNQYKIQLTNIDAQLEREYAQFNIDIDELNQQKKTAVARLSELDKQAEKFAERLKLNQQMVSQINTLKGTGYISELELQRQKDTLLSLQQQSSTMESERLSLNSQVKNVEAQLAKLPGEHKNRITQLQSRQSEIQIQLASVEQQRLGEIRAPQDGVVTGVTAKIGKSVNAGQRMVTLIPHGSEMQAILYVPTSAFGFIEPEQNTRLRYHAFPYEKFGVYDGKVTELSNSIMLPDEAAMPGIISGPAYRIVVELDTQVIQAYGKETPLRAGMMLDADIVVEERSLLRWLFDPVFSIKGQL